MSFTLSVEGEETPFQDQDLAALLAEVAAERIEFLILSRSATDEYVQAAGAHGGLLIERRDRLGSGWRHVRFAQPGSGNARLPPMVEGYEGVLERERLGVETGVSLFASFAAGQRATSALEQINLNEELGVEEESLPTKVGGWLRKLIGR